MPAALPQPPGWSLTARLLTASSATGDFYDAFPVAGGARIGLVIGTVDHQRGQQEGDAPLFMPLFRSLLRANALQDDFMPDDARYPTTLDDTKRLQSAVMLTNEYVAHTHSQADTFTTLFFGLLDPQTGALSYLNGGHEPPFILGTAGVKGRLPANSPVVGRWPGSTFPIATTHLALGDTLFAFTAGLIHAQNLNGEPFGRFRLARWLEQDAPSPILSPILSPTVLLDQIEAGLRAHQTGVALDQEITLFAISRA